MAERVDAPAEVPEGTTRMGLHAVSANTDGMEHLHPGNLHHLFKFILFLKYTVILLDRVTHFRKTKKLDSKNPWCPSKKEDLYVLELRILYLIALGITLC